MASTTQQQGDKNSVKEIFKTLNYGPAPEADNVAQVSGLELSNIFYCHDLNVVLTEKYLREIGESPEKSQQKYPAFSLRL